MREWSCVPPSIPGHDAKAVPNLPGGVLVHLSMDIFDGGKKPRTPKAGWILFDDAKPSGARRWRLQARETQSLNFGRYGGADVVAPIPEPFEKTAIGQRRQVPIGEVFGANLRLRPWCGFGIKKCAVFSGAALGRAAFVCLGMAQRAPSCGAVRASVSSRFVAVHSFPTLRPGNCPVSNR